MNKEETILLIEKAQNQQVNVKETIEHAMTLGFISLKHGYVCPLDEQDESPKTVPELMGKTFEDYGDFVDDAYYETVFNHLNKQAIYIPLAFFHDKTDEGYVEYASKKVIPHEEDLPIYTDYGIKIDNQNKLSFGCFGGAGCMQPPYFTEFEVDGDADDYQSLNCPLTQEIVEIVYNNIIFKS